MTDGGEAMAEGTVVRGAQVEPILAPWGGIKWMATGNAVDGVEQTFGVVYINPGQHNPVHYHPNCEELLYVLAGECDHRLNDAVVHLTPGDLLHVPRGVHHNATCTSWEPLRIIVSFSSPDRTSVPVEGDTAY